MLHAKVKTCLLKNNQLQKQPYVMNNQEFENAWDDACRNVANVEGFLSKKEMHFVFLLGAVQSCQGEILEIGSFKGRSTILLSKAAALANENRVVAVDPLTSPSVTDPDLKGKASARRGLMRTARKQTAMPPQ